MLLLVLSCLTSLIGSAAAAGPGPAGHSHLECGLRPSFESFLETGKRIGTGRSVQPGEFPWHVSIQSHRRHICGGTIISALWILTAAHCFEKELPPDLTVAVGGINLSVPLEEHKPDSLILHENFNNTSMANDIALILLSSPIEFSKEKIPICLPFMCDIHTWQHCWAAGWGSTSAVPGADAVPASHVLQKARVKLISREQCLRKIPQLQENMTCAEVEEGEEGNCQVDSGGPLVCSYWNTMKWFQVGIISEEKPNHKILTSVYSYLGWIENETAIRGKPFFLEGVDSGARPRVVEGVDSRAQPRVVEGVDSGAQPKVVEGVDSGAQPRVFEGVDSLAQPRVVEGVDSGALPRVVEGVDSGALPRVIRSGAGAQLMLLEHCCLLLISSIVISFLERRFF